METEIKETATDVGESVVAFKKKLLKTLTGHTMKHGHKRNNIPGTDSSRRNLTINGDHIVQESSGMDGSIIT